MNKDNHGQKKTDEVSDNMSVTYKPPLVIKDSMIALVSEISEEIGRISILPVRKSDGFPSCRKVMSSHHI